MQWRKSTMREAIKFANGKIVDETNSFAVIPKDDSHQVDYDCAVEMF
jgi:hypothetical protein